MTWLRSTWEATCLKIRIKWVTCSRSLSKTLSSRGDRGLPTVWMEFLWQTRVHLRQTLREDADLSSQLQTFRTNMQPLRATTLVLQSTWSTTLWTSQFTTTQGQEHTTFRVTSHRSNSVQARTALSRKMVASPQQALAKTELPLWLVSTPQAKDEMSIVLHRMRSVTQ